MRKWLLSVLFSNMCLILATHAYAEVADPTVKGPYAFSKVTTSLTNAGYQSAVVYLPKGEGPFPATTLCGGYSNRKEDISWLAERLASHGILTIAFTPIDPVATEAGNWAKGHVGAIETLTRESSKSTGVLAGKVDLSNLALTGYSFGGAGSLIAAKQLGTRIKAVVPMNAYRPIVSAIEAPVLFITGNKDTVALSQLVLSAFQGLSGDYPRAFANINGNDHFGPLNIGNKHQEISALVVPWLKVFVGNDAAYETYFRGEKIDQIVEDGMIFASPVDYVYLAPL
ncbi:MAG: hypothetical protein V4655_03705 [Bdellovibrionota bacterium]